ncbi:flagellar type III secretion system pore protein FliP [Criibacterium bergeronii]|uniref:Flagellar biosynthetic protein FliP n=2 Tax=Criibacterium bergeronii TaxID=1871336 RepID=A0A371IMM2_9FIRM|nr:flagellar type III secretion system pore protein FliP [Criibacterium bergeronii]MBS6062379.1 flagellar type III secretion system pore protein FliP [Peptostreptococcaceae bacterium]RDY21727.1 flagellar biosynthetic protein FliP [Criibacterium bergeronii]TRW28635.1 flagellar type III secretion system pore protein FliP [Criibacterium bergeronii]
MINCNKNLRRFVFPILILLCMFCIGDIVSFATSNIASPQAPVIPNISVNLGTTSNSTDLADSITLLLFFTVLSLLPSILIMMTSFTRIAVILSFLKQAMGTSQSIPSQVMIGLALFLTFFIMAPVGNEAYQNGLKPYFDKQITQQEAIDNSMLPLRNFMYRQTRESDLKLFIELSKDEKLNKKDLKLEEIPNSVLIPSFIISELKTGFQVGFLLFIPFIIIDMVVSSTLMSMGMMMLPPMMISMPFKILLFVLVDGWDLIVRSIVLGFR